MARIIKSFPYDCQEENFPKEINSKRPFDPTKWAWRASQHRQKYIRKSAVPNSKWAESDAQLTLISASTSTTSAPWSTTIECSFRESSVRVYPVVAAD